MTVSRITKCLFTCIATVSIIALVGLAAYQGISALTQTEDPVPGPEFSPTLVPELAAR